MDQIKKFEKRYNKQLTNLQHLNIKNMKIEQSKVFAGRLCLFACKRLLCLLLAGLVFFSVFNVQGQTTLGETISVSGSVSGTDGLPVIGSQVVVKGNSTIGTITDANGNYTLKGVPSNAVLIFSYISMETVEVPVENRTRVDVVMEPPQYLLDEITVVSIGYGTVRKRDLTGSVASIKGEELTVTPTATIAQSLQGRIPGVEVRTINSEPASDPQIRIRGISSIKGGNDPLWVIDGFAGSPNMLDPSDIESVEVLKDASATAIYGSRGGSGVIIVNTKQGREGKTQVDYNGSFGVSSLAKKMDMMNATQYMKFQNTAYANLGSPAYFSADQIANAGKGTDWQDVAFHTGYTSEHSVSVKAGTNKSRIGAGVSYHDEDGIIRGNEFKRLTMRANIDHTISSQVSFTASLIYSHLMHDKQAGVMPAALRASPTLTGYNSDGTYMDLGMAYTFSPKGMLNPEALVNERSQNWRSNRILGNASVSYKPVKGLTLRTAMSVNVNNNREDYYLTTKYPNNTDGNGSIDLTELMGITSETTATYSRLFGEHNISVLGGMVYEDQTTQGLGLSGSSFLTDLQGSYGIPGGSIIDTPTLSYSKWVILSFLGRLNYSFQDKYLLTATIRADGSSRFSPGDKWGYFPAVSAAWRIKEEAFLKDVRLVTNLKLRVGWGSVGNTAIAPYTTLDLLTPQDIVLGKEVYKAFHPSNYYNYGLVWEKTSGWNVGVDFGVLKDRISLTADYYYKRTTDLLNTVELPGSSGYISGTKNIGTIQNHGFEFQINARAIDRAVKWDISLNASFNKNKVVRLPYGEDVPGASRSVTFITDYINLIREGQPIGVFYGYVENGYDDRGRVVFRNFDDNPVINVNDRQIIGDPNPKCTFGFNTSVSWKGITLSAYFQGSYGNDIYSLSIAEFGYNYSANRGRNGFADILGNTWTPQNTNSKYPVLSSIGNETLRMSDRFVYDGSYLRMRTLELSYSIPVKSVSWLSSAVVYVSGQNLFTLTSYPFYNPDVNTHGGSSSVDQGIDYLSYPHAKGFTTGLRIVF